MYIQDLHDLMSKMPKKETLRKYYPKCDLSDEEMVEITKWLRKYLNKEFILPSNHMLKCLIEYEEYRRLK